MRRIKLTILLFLFILPLAAHPWKPRHYVIIDSDGGIDDLKAICMLLASPDVRVMGITVSDGFHSAPVAYENIRTMLDELYHEGLRVAPPGEAVPLIEKLLSAEETPVQFLALGSLKTVADAMDGSPSFHKKVKELFWSNSGVPGKDGTNYKSAPAAAEQVLAGSLPVTVTGGGGEGYYDSELLDAIGAIHTPYAVKIKEMISALASHSFAYTLFDEMIPVLLHYPELFSKPDKNEKVNYLTPADREGMKKAVIKIVGGETVEQLQIFKVMPVDTAIYMTDIQSFINDIRVMHGEDEWTSGVLANELHRHLGVFAIIGVKMGIRAREYFCTGVDEMTVLSHAGDIQPLSCMNDGLMVSTGATPGHALFFVSPDEPYFAGADFILKERTIRITLKKELADKVASELKEINFIYGLDSDIYWELVRTNSIRYWLQFDRHEIFNIEVIN